MISYFATFPAGTYDIIVKHLKSFRRDEIEITEHDESSVTFASSLPVEKLIELRYFTNVYRVIDGNLPRGMLKGTHFRLMHLRGGTPQPLEPAERTELEARIRREFGLTPDARQSRNDFYLIERDEGERLFTLKLPRAAFKREPLSAGELRPELAHILCLAAGIKAKDTVIDPFAGYGSIPLEAVRGFGCTQVIANDTHTLRGRRTHSAIKWHEADARSLPFVAGNSIDRVVTDPPWGMFEARVSGIRQLYADFAAELTRILQPGGVVVILSGYDEAAATITNHPELELINSWPILVSGKKATIYKLQKNREK